MTIQDHVRALGAGDTPALSNALDSSGSLPAATPRPLSAKAGSPAQLPVGPVTLVHLSVLKNGRARAIRFSTLAAICDALECQPGDVLTWRGASESRSDPAGFCRKIKGCPLPWCDRGGGRSIHW